LIAFQEAITTDEYDAAADVVGRDYQVVHQTVGLLGDGNHGATIASRWPLDEIREADLRVTPRTGSYCAGTVAAEILAPAPIGPLVFVAHGPSYEWFAELERELQAVAAARVVEEVTGARDVHVVVAGDFNAVPDAASIRFWCGRQTLSAMSVAYVDAWARTHPDEPGHTFSPLNPLTSADERRLFEGRRIDYIFVGCGEHGPTLDVERCELIFDEPRNGVWASDHFGVVADLAIPSE
jgi:endonuclease/exonuclease/phosphatase family metal-dependent hydrolase